MTNARNSQNYVRMVVRVHSQVAIVHCANDHIRNITVHHALMPWQHLNQGKLYAYNVK